MTSKFITHFRIWCVCRFPLVKRLDIKLLHIPDVGSCARKFLEKLLQRCGKTLCELRFSGALKTCVDLNVFNNCPSLQLLTIQGKAYDPVSQVITVACTSVLRTFFLLLVESRGSSASLHLSSSSCLACKDPLRLRRVVSWFFFPP